MTRVMDYDTGARLDGEPDGTLIEQSRKADYAGGAVPAYRADDGAWYYVQPSEADRMRGVGHEVRTVYVEDGVP